MSIDLEPLAAPSATKVHRQMLIAAVAVFSLALVWSAFLMFWIEPLFARMLLPRLGGTQAVWNTCLVFFQASLLLGYTYAHLLARWLTVRWQVLAHLAVLCVGLVFLPIALSPTWGPPATGSPVVAVFAVLAGSLGWPFFALSANSSLLQHWFSRSGHPRADNPYFLYAASNLGSLGALIAYPFLIEPSFTLGAQSSLWTWGYVALVIGIAATGAISVLVQRPGLATPRAAAKADPASRIAWPQRFAWIAYAALPSSLLLGVTGYATTDIASFPLLWLVPLALYLLTFILTFAAKPIIPHRWMTIALPLAVAAAAAGFWFRPDSVVPAFAIQFGAFFVVAMACHGELSRVRPGPAKLTEFYFFISLGGVIGGALTALVSPLVFNSIIEYPFVLAFTCLLRLGATKPAPMRVRLIEIFILGVAIILVLAKPFAPFSVRVSEYLAQFTVMMIFAFGLWPKHFRPALIAMSLLLASIAFHDVQSAYGPIIARERSFYGAYKVDEAASGTYRDLSHGTTLHGVERISLTDRPIPLSYYTPDGALGDIMKTIGPRSQSVGLIGLGIGSTACYARADQSWTIYEIDPLVYKLAAQSGYFRSLPVCAPQAKMVFGDGRLKLEAGPAGQFDLLIVDAFASDAIPIHLLTREGFQAYVRSLKPHGVLVVHVTSRHFDLAPVVARIAPEAGLVAYSKKYAENTAADPAVPVSATWMALARSPADLGPIAADPSWTRRDADPKTKLWTDDFANILSALK